TGNAAEWTQGVFVPFHRNRPYRDDERNRDDTPGLRVARGGSWYSAATSYLYIPYRDAFQPEHSSQETGFRVVVRRLP
ncbi:MAG TPA: SUMF1/EgtB/PvdO family nonheme iron enzyme, partial [Bacteroidota bacterium]|nr:SUMF1/EgtB/PvdO family nonheme iron enzyme [Bacteroidota bacterium]